ncbi:hypothetical protein IU450_38820 [Nocardia abscessus]|uniref:hypothetical protein n=1 Tax=Nocardia abscessus TaxID=120957 RepID=UPI0018960004|nr:hypothetical protein [Nocardia abscessus]MBF6341791.1 hypothetical protein [Nocardia abscessus]
MYSTPTPAILGSALYRVFAASTEAPDSLALWIEIADAAVRELNMPVLPSLVPWVPIVLRYRLNRTEGEFFPFTGSVRIMTGPLTGTLYPDRDAAARAVVDATLATGRDEGDTSDGGDGEQTEAVPEGLPSWRFRNGGAPTAFTPRAVPPLVS